jgi:hypothetical protein
MIRHGAIGLVSFLPRVRPIRSLLVPLPLVVLLYGSGCLGQTQPVSLFSNALPANPVDPYTGPATLGVKFVSSQNGRISAIRFYRAAKCRNGYIARLYQAGIKRLASVSMASESGPVPGWQTALFPVPISIAANTTYLAAYYAPCGQYSETWHGLGQTVSNGPLSAPAASLVGGNGVMVRGLDYPTNDYLDGNFFVDVAFTPGLPYLSIVVTPPNPSIPSATPLGAVVANVAATWSDGAPFTGALLFVAPNFNHGGVYALDSNNNLIINPLGPGVGSAGGSTATITIGAIQ